VDKKNEKILKMNKDISKKLKWTKEKLKGEKKKHYQIENGTGDSNERDKSPNC